MLELVHDSLQSNTTAELKFFAAAFQQADQGDGSDSPVLWTWRHNSPPTADQNQHQQQKQQQQKMEKKGRQHQQQQQQVVQHQQQRKTEDLFKMYEELTDSFQDLTFKDLVKNEPQIITTPRHKKNASSPSNAAPRPVVEEQPRGSVSFRVPQEHQYQHQHQQQQPQQQHQQQQQQHRARVSPQLPSPTPNQLVHRHSVSTSVPTLTGSQSMIPINPLINARPEVQHGSNCYTCDAGSLFFKTRCLVCGKLYCRQCVKSAMGSMIEGRKCRSCLGQCFSQRYIARAGKGWWMSNQVKVAELKWAKKRPNYTIYGTQQVPRPSV